MSFLRAVAKSRPFIQRLTARHLSTSSTAQASYQKPSAGSVIRWVSGIAAGSALGALVYPFSPDHVDVVDDGVNQNNNVSSITSKLLDNLKVKSKWAFAGWSSAPVSDDCFTPSLPTTNSSSSSLLVKKSRFLFNDAYRRKVFFKYEKRIRTRSPPEKVFEYFASVRNSDGEILMKPADLMRAVVPVFPPSESHIVRDGYLPGERPPGELRCPPSEFFMLFDMNNDGHISFKEYIFFVTLLSIPESSFSVAFKMFDVDNNGEIDKDEFKQVMSLMRAQHRQGTSHSDGLRAGIKHEGAVENGGLVEYFFGEDGGTHLHHDKFVQFLRHLHDEIVRLEFSHYDYKSQGSISAKDFALSMVAAADITHINKLLDRVDELDKDQHLSDARISENEFRKFAELRTKLEPFALALFSYGKVNGLLTRRDFQRAASQVCGVNLTDKLVDIIFHVFDANRDGNLSAHEFLRVLHKRQRDVAQPMESGVSGFLSCFWDCKSRCSLSRLLKT